MIFLLRHAHRSITPKFVTPTALSCIIYTRWSSGRYELGCDAPMVMLTPRDQCQFPIIRFVPKTLHQTLTHFTASTSEYPTNRKFMVRDCRLMISFGFEVTFYIEKQFHGVHTWSDYSMDKYDIWIADEMDMTPLQVRYWWAKFLPQSRSGTPSTITYTRSVGTRDSEPCS